MPKPHSGYDLIAAIQAAEDYLKLKTLTPCLLGLEFYERSLEKGHRHEAAAGRDCSARAVPAKATGSSTIGPRQKDSARKLTYIEPVPDTSFTVGAGIYDDKLTTTDVETASGQ